MSGHATINGSTAFLYDASDRAGAPRPAFGLRSSPQGALAEFAPPQRVSLPSTGWRIARGTQAEDDAARVVMTLEDTPFYARSLVELQLLGERTHAMHESLSLDRYRMPAVKAMLPFRMPRRG